MLNTKSIKKVNTIYNDEKKVLLTESDNNDNVILLNNDNVLLNNDNVLTNDIFLNKNNENIIKESIIILNEDIIDNNIKIGNNNIIFDENKNAFVINSDNCIFTIIMSDIMNYIINLSTNDNSIKKYIFIISFNNITNNNEFNFVNNTLFTNNLEMMIKLQNLLYENINRDDFSKNEDIDKNKFLMFYYQLVIFMFKTTYDEKIYDKYKIINTYSTLAFRISTVILKQTFSLQQKYENISQELDNIMFLKNSLHLKINKLSKQINIINEISENSEISNEDQSINNTDKLKSSNISINNSIKYSKKEDNVENLIDSLTSSIIDLKNNNSNKTNSNKNSEKNNLKISKNAIDSLTFDSDNKYEEIDETSEPNNEYINDLIKISSMSNSTKDNSYNSKSVINNGKTYFNI